MPARTRVRCAGTEGYATPQVWAWILLSKQCKSMPVQGDSRIGILLCVAIVMGYLYQGPPFRCAILWKMQNVQY